MNLDLLEKTRIELSKKKYSTCLEYLKAFFDDLKGSEKDHFRDIMKLFDVVETRYEYEVESRKNTGGILFEPFITKFERSIDTLADVILWEIEKLNHQTGSDVKVVLVVKTSNIAGGDEEERILFEKIKHYLRKYIGYIDTNYKWLFRKGDNTYLGWCCKRNYELLCKLKSISKLKILPYLEGFNCLDTYMDRFCEAMVDLQLNFEKMEELSRYIQQYSLRLTAQKEKGKSMWRKELEYRLGGVGEKIEEKAFERTGKYIFDRGTAFTFDLSWANLEFCNLDLIQFANSNFMHANMHKLSLVNALLIGCNLQKVDLSYSKMSNVKAVNSSFQNTNLSHSDLYASNLKNANLSNTKLSRTNFDCADLSGVDFSFAIIENTNFHYANLSGANLSKANFTDKFFSKKK